MAKTTVYRMYNATGDLLYAGVAADPGRRFKQHQATKSWWDQVVTLRLEHFGNRLEALKAETQAILNEHPRWNIIGRRDTSWDLLRTLADNELDILEIIAVFTVGIGRELWDDVTPSELFNGSERTRAEFPTSIRERMLWLVGPNAKAEIAQQVPRLKSDETVEIVFDRLKDTVQREFDEWEPCSAEDIAFAESLMSGDV
jgi:predicted GIY-YIG superfamily endonuclease